MPRINPETKFKVKVQEKLKQVPGLWNVKIQQVALRGIPDLLICYKGMFYAWELKTSTGKLDSLQEHTLNNIKQAGGTSRVVTPANLDECMEELLGTKNS